MSVTLRVALPADLACLLPVLDQEFVLAKRRHISLARRFPTVFCLENIDNIFLCEDAGVILSAFAVKRFDWLDEGKILRGAMVGAVYTDPQRRREGRAGHLLDWGMEQLRARGVDFAVLWTAHPEFYARLGWVAADCGVLGKIDNTVIGDVSSDGVSITPVESGDVQALENIRTHWLPTRSPRSAADYRQLPLPVDAVDLLWSGAGAENAAYALVGHADDAAIVYEMLGHPNAFGALWQAICNQHHRIMINDQPRSASYAFLSKMDDLIWQNKPLAMWLPLSGKVDVTPMLQWYIPYFDRI